MKILIMLPLILLVAGCEIGYGVFRNGPANSVPDMDSVAKRIKTYPEVEEVNYSHSISSSRPITFHGLEKGDELYCIRYTGGENVHGTLSFSMDYRGRITYSQYLLSLNRPLPQRWVDATWPVMMKVEYDLVHRFGLTDLSRSATTSRDRVEDPDRNANKPAQTDGDKPSN
jgi:hypothetical protein